MRSILLFAVALTIATGCQTSPRLNRHIELLNGEKRALEDHLYELEFEFEDALEELDELKRENSELQKRLGIPSSQRAPSSRFDRTRSDSDRGPSELDVGPPVVDEGMLTEPKIELPRAKAKENEKPAPNPPSMPMTSRGSGKSSPRVPTVPSLEPADPRVTHIYLNPLLTGGSDFDRQPGDDGLIVAIEPRNSENAFVPLAGPISVVLIDPAQQATNARIARWDLQAGETQQALQTAHSEKGIQLQLPWPQQAPTNSRLQLFVRYITVDGRKLEASRDIYVTLPGQFSQRWTPRSSGRIAANDPNGPITENHIVEASPAELNPAEPLQAATVQAEPVASPRSAIEPASHSQNDDGATSPGEPSTEAATPMSPGPQWQPSR